MSTPVPRSIFSNKRNDGFLKKWLIPGLGQGKCKINMKHFIVLESEEMRKQNKIGGMLKGYESQAERAPNGQSWNNLSINK